MKYRLKHGHPHHGKAAPFSPTGQPGKRTVTPGTTTGSSGGAPTPVKHRPTEMGDIYGKPFEVSPDGAPGHGRDYPKYGPKQPQPGHPDLHSHKPTVTGGAQVSVVSTTARPKTVKGMIRQKTGSSHSARMRKEGQHMHERGAMHGHDGKIETPYTERGKHPKQPGRPHIAAQARLDDHLPDRETKNMLGEVPGGAGNIVNRGSWTIQPRVAKYGSKERFLRLRMTRKRDHGGAS